MSILDILRRPRRTTREEYLQKLLDRGLNEDGTPVLDPTPLAPPIGYKKHPSMVDIVRDMIKSERLKHEVETSGHETFEEADDFEMPDEPESLRSLYENEQDPTIQDLLAAGADAVAAKTSALPPESPLKTEPSKAAGPESRPPEPPKGS